MKKPKTYGELLTLVNPTDLLEVLDFSGVNDKIGSEHSILRRKFSNMVYNSMDFNNPKSPVNQGMPITNEYYDTIVKCIQDFYYWSHRFNHIYAHIYQRVCNVLNIPKEIYEVVAKLKEI